MPDVSHGTIAVNGKISMNREDINKLLEQVIQEARALKIPVPDHIIGEVYINGRPKKRFGCCRKKDGRFLIEISEFILSWEEDRVRGILAHEVLHTCEGCSNHGPLWKEYAERMNRRYGYQIKRVSSFEDMGIGEDLRPDCGKKQEDRIRYIIKCTKCGKEYPRQRFTCVMKKINAYRCQCGGKLVLLEVQRTNKYTQ